MWHELLRDARFHELLVEADRQIAAEVTGEPACDEASGMNSPMVFVAAVLIGSAALAVPWKRWRRRLAERRLSRLRGPTASGVHFRM